MSIEYFFISDADALMMLLGQPDFCIVSQEVNIQNICTDQKGSEVIRLLCTADVFN